MPDYTAYNAGLQGFMTGRKLAREDTQYKQEQESNNMLTGLMEKEYNSMNPEGQPISFKNLDPVKAMAAVNFARQEATRIEGKRKEKISSLLEIYGKGMDVLKTTKGEPQKLVAKELLRSVIPEFQKEGLLKDVDLNVLLQKIDTSEEKDVTTYIKELYDADKSHRGGAITLNQLHDLSNKATLKMMKAVSPEDQKPYLDELATLRKSWEPKTEAKDADEPKRAGFEKLYPSFIGRLGTAEYADAFRDYINKTKEKLDISISGAEARGRSFNNERFYTMYDTQSGKAIKIKGLYLNNDSNNRYIDLQDPNLKADTGSLVKITKGMDSVGAFEKGASQALDYSLSVAKDFGLGKYPKANQVSQLFQYHLGDPKVKGLKNAITTAATEYMKVINAGSDLTAAELSVMGQQRAKEIIESADNFESLKNSVKIMQREMQISGDKFKAQQSEIKGRLKGYGPPQEAEAPKAKPTARKPLSAY